VVETRPLRVLFLGASVTEGWFASARNRTYPEIVADRLGATGRRVHLSILSRPGVTAGGADAWDLAIPSDVVIVQLATNDFMQSVPALVYSAYYGDLLHRLRRASPTAELVCLGGWDDPSAANRLGVLAVDYDVEARTACGAEGGRYVDLSATFLDARNHGPEGRVTFHGPGDVFHPNDRGHEEVATLILGDGPTRSG
jgi:lysophospholipase L1-like esterase